MWSGTRVRGRIYVVTGTAGNILELGKEDLLRKLTKDEVALE
jgi:hypothetical protein